MNPYIQILLATIIWGTSGVYTKLIGLPSLTLSAIRMMAPAAILLIYLIYSKQIFSVRRLNKWLILASFINIVRVIMYFIGFKYTSIGKAVVLLYTWPIFVSIGAVLHLKEKISYKMMGLISLAFLGTIILEGPSLFSRSNTHIVGDIAMLISALCSAITVLIFKAKSHGLSHTQKVFYQNVIGALVSIPFIPLLFANQPPMQIGIAILYASLAGVLGYYLFFSALSKIPSSRASSLAYFEVVTTIIFGFLILSEPITWTMILGGSMIFISVIFLHRSRPEELE